MRCFGKKMLPHKHNFSLAMHGRGISPYNKRSSKQGKQISVKLIYSIKTNTSKCLVKFLRNSIKYVVSRAVSGAISGALKVALLRAMVIQSVFSDDFDK